MTSLEGSRGDSWTGQLNCWVEVEGPGRSAERVKASGREVKKIWGTMHGGGLSAWGVGEAAAEEKTPVKASKSEIASCIVRPRNVDQYSGSGWDATAEATLKKGIINGLRESEVVIYRVLLPHVEKAY